jgi:antitoxin component YwqK of YwqJK toxin-antitoxin module
MDTDLQTERIEYEDGGYAEIQMLNGENHGWWIVFRADGSKHWERHYQNGKQHGPEREWFPDGKLDHEWNFVGGELNGPWKTWHANGQIKNDAYFTNGEKDLYDRWYDPDGALVAEQRIFKGVKHGTQVCTVYDEDTCKETTGVMEFKDGTRVGFTPFPESVDYFYDDE